MATSDKLFCSLCEEEGVYNPAFHWCTDCCCFLCYQCCRHHQRNKASKDHQTIPTENYQELPEFMRNTRNYCLGHDKRFEIYCSVHECACCAQCVADNHKTCPDLKNIEEVFSKIKSSVFMSNIHDKLLKAEHNYDNLLMHLTQELASVHIQKTDKLDELNMFRKLLNLQLDNLEKQFNDQIESQTESLIDKLFDLTENVTSKRSAIETEIKDYDSILNYGTDLQIFVGLGSLNKKLKADAEFFTKIKDNQELRTTNFEINFSPTLFSVLDLENLGEISQNLSKEHVEIKPLESAHNAVPIKTNPFENIRPILLKTFNVSEKDNQAWVIGCALLSNDDCVIVDQELPYVKQYKNDGQLVNKMCFDSAIPYDVCVIDDTTIAVSSISSSPDHDDILFVKTETNKVERKIWTGPGNKSLFFGDYLVVGRDETDGDKGEIVLIDACKESKIINRFTTEALGSVFTLKNKIYYTEYYTHSVVCSDELGNIIWRFKDPSILTPYGIVVDNLGFVFVTCHDSNSVMAISPDGNTSGTILIVDDGLKEPFALAMNSDCKKLMVCNLKDGTVFLYKL